ncbi:MAG: ATP-binding protein, partial [Christensenella sp.]
DDGVGMSEDHLGHIFERFYRVDKARSRETGGTGLGLHIVRRIALMHGGRVDVQSTEGAGSVFTLVLPLVQNTES